MGLVNSSDYRRALLSVECNEIYFSKDNFLLLNDSSIHNEVSMKFNQEEADSKVILHCLDILNDLEETIVLRSLSADTDIIVHIIVTIE